MLNFSARLTEHCTRSKSARPGDREFFFSRPKLNVSRLRRPGAVRAQLVSPVSPCVPLCLLCPPVFLVSLVSPCVPWVALFPLCLLCSLCPLKFMAALPLFLLLPENFDGFHFFHITCCGFFLHAQEVKGCDSSWKEKFKTQSSAWLV